MLRVIVSKIDTILKHKLSSHESHSSGFDKAKIAFDEILRKLDTALNNGTSNMFRSAILQWAHDDRGVVVESHITNDTSVRRVPFFVFSSRHATHTHTRFR